MCKWFESIRFFASFRMTIIGPLGVVGQPHKLVVTIYKLSTGLPGDELFDLTAQLRRAAASTPARIAGGFKRATISEKLRYFNIAQGSLEEVRY